MEDSMWVLKSGTTVQKETLEMMIFFLWVVVFCKKMLHMFLWVNRTEKNGIFCAKKLSIQCCFCVFFKVLRWWWLLSQVKVAISCRWLGRVFRRRELYSSHYNGQCRRGECASRCLDVLCWSYRRFYGVWYSALVFLRTWRRRSFLSHNKVLEPYAFSRWMEWSLASPSVSPILPVVHWLTR